METPRICLPRISPVEPPFDPAVGAALADMMPPGVETLGLFRTFARNLPMATAMQGWGSYELGRALSVGRREREIVILRTCARCRCSYEWGVHAAIFAERVGLSADQVAATGTGVADDPAWTGSDAVLVRLVDELHDGAAVSDGLWAELSSAFSAAQVLDLLALTGWYHAISYLANGARVTPETWAPALP